MEEKHRKAIQNNFSTLVEQTDLDLMVSVLYEKGVFSEIMIEPYQDKNKDVRERKRRMYSDIMRRGPYAFQHLLDALQENGYWNIVRDLDPDTMLKTSKPNLQKSQGSQSSVNGYISLRRENKKIKDKEKLQAPVNTDTENNVVTSSPVSPPLNTSDVPKFNVVKSTHFIEETPGIQLYRTRGRKRGVLLVFSYTQFRNNVETPRPGSDVDCNSLKYLFSEMGFRALAYVDLGKNETLKTLQSLQLNAELLAGAECAFIVFSSHGYEVAHSSDTQIRTSDNQIITTHEIVDYFNNIKCPMLKGKPKVFIFQCCRGTKSDYDLELVEKDGSDEAGGRVVNGRGGAGDAAGAEHAGDAPDASVTAAGHAQYGAVKKGRVYSDILMAYSTLPQFVSHRDTVRGSWYIQVLCEVFAAEAHEAHVERLLTMVDRRLAERYHQQTSAVETWGFNRRLYLHPGLFDDDAS